MKLKAFAIILLGLSGLAFALSPDEAHRYHECCYHRDLGEVISEAKEHLLAHVKQNKNREKQQPLAIVFDIDETTISNFHIMRDLDFKTNAINFREQIVSGKQGTTLKPSLELYQLAKEHNVAVFFITGRDELLHQVTSDNLRQAGYRDWDGLYLKPIDYSEKSIVPFKAGARSKIEKMGYKIIASIGDQHSDHDGGFHLKGFKLPNPYYQIS